MEYDRFVVGNGEIIVARGTPDERLFKRIRDATRPQLVVNGELGYLGSNLDFLHEIGPLLVSLEVVGSFEDDSGIASCINLEELNLNTDCSGTIDWTLLRRLRHLFAYNSRLNSTFQELPELEDLNLYGATDDDLDLVGSIALRELHLISTKITRVPVGDTWSRLKTLEVRQGSRLKEFSGIAEMKQLESLSLRQCRHLRSLEPVSACRNLTHLGVTDCGPVESLAPLESCTALERLFFAGSTNIVDGDLRVLGRLPHLERAMYMRRRHYHGAPARFPTMD